MLKLLRSEGYSAAVVEKWNPWAGPRRPMRQPCGCMVEKAVGVRQDLWGFVDIVAVRPDKTGTLYVQSTVAARLADHLRTALAKPELKALLEARNRFECHGWIKRPKTKTRPRERWEVVRREIVLTTSKAQPYEIREIEEEPF